jgi:hypothetical protein
MPKGCRVSQPRSPLIKHKTALAWLLALLVWMQWCAHVSGASEVSVVSGEDLFYGRANLNGQLYLHNRPFGAALVRCANCHQLQDEVPKENARFGPALGAQFLSVPNSQRGGPARAYDLPGFCAMLRNGIDPSGILIRTDMPRYTLDTEACSALWFFLQKH